MTLSSSEFPSEIPFPWQLQHLYSSFGEGESVNATHQENDDNHTKESVCHELNSQWLLSCSYHDQKLTLEHWK